MLQVAAALSKPADELCRQRTALLARLLREGSGAKAWKLFDGLLARQQATTFQLTVMLKELDSSSEKLALVLRHVAAVGRPAALSDGSGAWALQLFALQRARSASEASSGSHALRGQLRAPSSALTQAVARRRTSSASRPPAPTPSESEARRSVVAAARRWRERRPRRTRSTRARRFASARRRSSRRAAARRR